MVKLFVTELSIFGDELLIRINVDIFTFKSK